MSFRKARGRLKINASPRKPRANISNGVETLSSTPARDDAGKRQKIAAITKALTTDPVDQITLKQLAISFGGLLSDDLRKKAWPKLLQVDVTNIPPKPDEEVLHGHSDYQQVVLDVNRSLKRFPPGMEEAKRMSLQDQLVDVIMWVLVTHPELHYYQGYHDICVTFLLAVGEDITFALMDKLSTNHFRDFMDTTMEKTTHMLNYLYPIIAKAHPELRDFMEKADVGTVFCLSWLITWFGHVLNHYRHIVRLYDFFVASHPLMPIYLAAAIVLYRAKEVLACECEMCFVHSLLSKIPDDLPFEQLVSKAGDLFIQYPPKEVAHEVEIWKRRQQEKRRAAEEESRRRQVARKAGLNHKGQQGSILVRVTVWTLTAAFSAAAFAVLQNSYDWHKWFW